MVCVPPKTRTLGKEEYEKMLKDTSERVEEMIKSDNLTMMRDLNCKEM